MNKELREHLLTLCFCGKKLPKRGGIVNRIQPNLRLCGYECLSELRAYVVKKMQEASPDTSHKKGNG